MARISVTVDGETGTTAPATLPDDSPIALVIDELIDFLDLPQTSVAGERIDYGFTRGHDSELLDAELTLAESGVYEGDLLTLVAIGGGGPPRERRSGKSTIDLAPAAPERRVAAPGIELAPANHQAASPRPGIDLDRDHR